MTAVPARVYETEADALTDVATIDAALGYPLPGATTWAEPVQRWDGKWWIVCPCYNGHNIDGLIGTFDPDANAWPEVP
jgi:hypothetical protein